MLYRLLICAALPLLAQSVYAEADPAAVAQQAQELLTAGKPALAAGLYRDLVRQFPSNAGLRVNLCIAEFQSRQYREAMADAAQALQLQPDLPAAQLFLGASRLELGDAAGAVPPLQQALAAHPDDRNALLLLAQALLGAARTQEALQMYQHAAELAPDNPKVWYGLGRSSEAVSNSAAAAQAWERLRSLPPSPEYYMHQAALLEQAGEYVEAARLWRAALPLSPGDVRLETGLVWALYKARDHTSALPLIDTLLNSNPQSAELNFLRGACLINLEQPAQALPSLELAISLDPALLPAQAALGQALLRTRQAAQAIPHLQAALAADQDGAVHFQLYRAYQMAGHQKEARRTLAEYQAMQH